MVLTIPVHSTGFALKSRGLAFEKLAVLENAAEEIEVPVCVRQLHMHAGGYT